MGGWVGSRRVAFGIGVSKGDEAAHHRPTLQGRAGLGVGDQGSNWHVHGRDSAVAWPTGRGSTDETGAVRRVVLVMVLLLTAAPSAHAADDLDGDTLLFAFTGDVLTHLNVNSAARRHGTPYDFRPLFEPVRHLISGADFSVCH